MLQKIGIKTVLNVTGTVLGIAGTILTGMASQKAMEQQVAKEVAKQLNK